MGGGERKAEKEEDERGVKYLTNQGTTKEGGKRLIIAK